MAAVEVLSSEGLLEHWEGHRRLTRRTVAAFPEEELFNFSPLQPLRPFADMVKEILNLTDLVLQGVTTGEWDYKSNEYGNCKADLLAALDNPNEALHARWQGVNAEKLKKIDSDPFMTDRPNLQVVLYAIDNEIHHRAQGYVYLRLLGIEPPPFYERLQHPNLGTITASVTSLLPEMSVAESFFCTAQTFYTQAVKGRTL
jgi:uncharacterized damage-inducible protein DinB